MYNFEAATINFHFRHSQSGAAFDCNTDQAVMCSGYHDVAIKEKAQFNYQSQRKNQ